MGTGGNAFGNHIPCLPVLGPIWPGRRLAADSGWRWAAVGGCRLVVGGSCWWAAVGGWRLAGGRCRVGSGTPSARDSGPISSGGSPDPDMARKGPCDPPQGSRTTFEQFHFGVIDPSLAHLLCVCGTPSTLDGSCVRRSAVDVAGSLLLVAGLSEKGVVPALVAGLQDPLAKVALVTAPEC